MKVLVVAAHPDDEVLGCGGVIARHAAEGSDVHILIMAEGATARHDTRDEAHPAIGALREAARQAANVLGAREPRLAGFPDNRMDEVALLDVIKTVEAVVGEVRPSIVYTHHGGDLNVDHRIVHEAVVTACRPLPETPVRSLYAFETVSSTEWAPETFGQSFRPTRFVDIATHLDRKLQALESYTSEMRSFPHPRSRENVVALARHRGACAGIAAAEAFMVIREIVR